MITKNQLTSDYIKNRLYRIRFWFYRNFKKSMFVNKSAAVKKGRKLVFKDNFRIKSWGTQQEKKKWHIGEHWGPFHPEKTLVYAGQPKIVTFEGEKVAEFSVKYNPKTFPGDVWFNTTGKPITIPFEVSYLSSYYTFKQNHGRFECRCTIPHEKGTWPAFWLWGSTWPPEIDILEMFGKKDGKSAGIQKPNLHYGIVKEGTKESAGSQSMRIERKTKTPQFHEFVCEWSEDKIEMFTDGIKVFTYSRKEVLDKWFNVDLAKMWIVINHSIAKTYIKKDDKDYTSVFYVDYIRAYE